MIQGNFRITLQNGNTVPFSVSPSSAVDQASVTLTLIRPLDYESIKMYNLQVMIGIEFAFLKEGDYATLSLLWTRIPFFFA